MPQFIALLRGINVGKAKRVPMAQLRALLGDLGYTGIATLLNSGNAVFHADKGTPSKHAAQIAAALASALNFKVPIVVKSGKELTAIVAENPLTEQTLNHSRLLVAFPQDAKTLAELKAIESLTAPPEQIIIGKHAAYLHCPAGILESKAGAALLGKVVKAVTTRNWATVLKLQAMLIGQEHYER